MAHILREKQMIAYQLQLLEEEKSAATIEKYLRDIRTFAMFLQSGEPVTKEAVLRYKQTLSERYKSASVNSMLVALNRFLTFLHWDECRVRLVKVQRQCFRDRARELTREEYLRLVHAARARQNERLCCLLQAICSTGIRVSEHQFITVDALRTGRAQVVNKGKQRTVFLPPELCTVLLQYCKRRGIGAGPVFITRTGRAMNRCNIWSEMKNLCQTAGVDARKVFPHNLRHLFAVTYYALEKDVLRLADLLGHASIDTTRIYTFTSGEEHAKSLSRLRLVI